MNEKCRDLELYTLGEGLINFAIFYQYSSAIYLFLNFLESLLYEILIYLISARLAFCQFMSILHWNDGHIMMHPTCLSCNVTNCC